MKVCLAASSGGHLNQLLATDAAWRRHDGFFVVTSDVSKAQLTRTYGRPVFVVGESNHRHPLRLVGVLLRCLKLLVRHRPDVVVSTGAAHGCLLCILARLMGARTVWIDSIANMRRLSLSGRLVRPFADLFLVQWPDLMARYPGTEYHGELV